MKHRIVNIPALHGIASALIGALALGMVQAGAPVAALLLAVDGLCVFVLGMGKVVVYWR